MASYKNYRLGATGPYLADKLAEVNQTLDSVINCWIASLPNGIDEDTGVINNGIIVCLLSTGKFWVVLKFAAIVYSFTMDRTR